MKYPLEDNLKLFPGLDDVKKNDLQTIAKISIPIPSMGFFILSKVWISISISDLPTKKIVVQFFFFFEKVYSKNTLPTILKDVQNFIFAKLSLVPA